MKVLAYTFGDDREFRLLMTAENWEEREILQRVADNCKANGVVKEHYGWQIRVLELTIPKEAPA